MFHLAKQLGTADEPLADIVPVLIEYCQRTCAQTKKTHEVDSARFTTGLAFRRIQPARIMPRQSTDLGSVGGKAATGIAWLTA